MLKAVRQTYQDQQNNTIHFIRNYQVVQIRKNKRDQLFRKRRTVLEKPKQQCKKDQPSNQQIPSNRKKIIDPTIEELQKFVQQQYTNDMLEQLQKYLESEDILQVHKGAIGIRKLLSQIECPIQQILQLQIEEKLIQLSKSSYPQLKFESVWSLANLTFGNQLHCQILIQKGVIQCLFEALKSQYIQIVEHSIWGIGNLSFNVDVRKRILLQNGINKIISIIDRFSDVKLVQQACWGIAQLIRGNPPLQYNLVQRGILFLCCIIQNDCITDQQILAQCLAAISCNCQFTNQIDKGAHIRNSGIIAKIVPLILSQNKRLMAAVLRLIGNFSTGGQQVTNLLFSFNLLENIEKRLYDSSAFIRQQICWILSNLAAGTEKNVLYLLDQKRLIGKLGKMLIQDEISIKKEIIFIFTNLSASCGNYEIQQLYLSHQLLDCMVDLLKSQDQKLKVSVLKNLNLILKRAQKRNKLNILTQKLFRNKGVNILEKLQYQSNKIYNEVSKIFKNFFQCQNQILQEFL